MPLERLYSATTFKSGCHQWLWGCFHYLSQPACGEKNTETRLEHLRLVSTIMKSLETEGNDVICLATKSGDVGWTHWIQTHHEHRTRALGTLISHITSLEKNPAVSDLQQIQPKGNASSPCTSQVGICTHYTRVEGMDVYHRLQDSATADAMVPAGKSLQASH